MISNHSIKESGLANRWDRMKWDEIEERVQSMQMEISKASRDGDRERLDSLTDEFLGSFEAKALAVRNVTRNEATDNPGMGEEWSTSADRMKAVMILDHHGYRTEPFYSFVMFEPKTKKDRTMCIPTFYDRAMHDLFRMMMEPLCEPLYDKRLFSSRKGRSLTDAVAEVRYLFSDADSPEWVVRCDVKSFYDTMSHEWLLDHVPMDRDILNEFLKAPRIENGTGKPTVPSSGVPTGNRMSPVLANMMLNGLEDILKNPGDPDDGIVVRWVDDIVVTARTEDGALRYMARVKRFVTERGMSLNERKSYVTNVRDGFEFLKYRYVKEGDTVRLTPLDGSVDDLIESVREAVRKHDDEHSVIKTVNSHVRGFTNKYRISDMSGCAQRIDKAIVEIVAERVSSILHVPYESVFTSRIREDGRGWIFRSNEDVWVRRVSDVVPVDHERVWLTANPYIDTEYFDRRGDRERVSKVANDGLREIWESSGGCCRLCGMRIRRSEPRTLVTSEDGSKGYVHIVCKDECDTLRGRIVFIEQPSVGTEDIPLSEPPETEEPEDMIEKEPSGNGEGDPTYVAEETVMTEGEPSETEDGRDVTGQPHMEQLKLVPVEKKVVIVPTKKGISKFQPLVNHLNEIPYSFFDLSFMVVDSLLIGGLCDYAYRQRDWWFRKGKASIGKALQSTEWGVQSVDMEKQSVRFSKDAKIKYTPPEIAFRNRNYGPQKETYIAERDERMRKSPFGNVTRFLLSSGLDQIRLTFSKIDELIGTPLPEYSQKKPWWSNRKPRTILSAIEDADFTKVELDMEGRTILLTRTCCIPDPNRDAVVLGDLKIKPHMRPRKQNRS